MDHDFYRSLGFVEHSHKWNNATHIGTATPLSAAQRSVLIRLRFPEAEYKFTKRVHWFKLANPPPDAGLAELDSLGHVSLVASLDAE